MALKKKPTDGLFNGNPYVLSSGGTASPGYFETNTSGTVVPDSVVEELYEKVRKPNPYTSSGGASWHYPSLKGSLLTTTGTMTTAVGSGGFTFIPEAHDTRPIVEALVRDLIHRKYPKAKLL